MHHDRQNEILDVMAHMIREQISGEIQDAELFALMVEESPVVRHSPPLLQSLWSILQGHRRCISDVGIAISSKTL